MCHSVVNNRPFGMLAALQTRVVSFVDVKGAYE